LHYEQKLKRSGIGAKLKYIDDEDLKSKKVRLVPEVERKNSIDDGPDSDDLISLRRNRMVYNYNSPTSTNDNNKDNSDDIQYNARFI
jgi:hypothetical protein